jgi:hypothetical protein
LAIHNNFIDYVVVTKKKMIFRNLSKMFKLDKPCDRAMTKQKAEIENKVQIANCRNRNKAKIQPEREQQNISLIKSYMN